VERIISLKIKKLPEGFFLATSDDVQGLVAQGNFLTETIEIAEDIAINLMNLHGQEISSMNTNLDKGISMFSVTTHSLASGVYFVNITYNGVVLATEKVMITK